ncbi:MAG: NADH-dependent alcohol dehydrogenase [Candidatus Cloacimonadota bacterium]|nr:MAG: NADH-dependent alcohol dehydrogenase [Candidatus Cloacimonadota bacterium]PIE78045.1 MAG: NADH-dependent alcohol dehydrogenase [Candidatus Delongbacteria bacterium]
MENFTSNLSTKIFFGEGEIQKLGEEILLHGKRVLFIYGKSSIKRVGIYDKVIEQFRSNNIFYKEVSGVDPNPDIKTVREAKKVIIENNLDFILAVGGGSVIDCSKAISAAAMYSGDPWDFLEYKVSVEKALPIGAVLTLAATGSEMNGGSVISNREINMKRSFRSDLLKPVFSILDPTYTYSVSKYHTAAGAVDIFVHVTEQYFSNVKGTFIQDRLCESVIKTVIEYGRKAVENPEDYEARANLMWGATIGLNGLLGFGKVTDWATHMIEHELSAFYELTHGMGLAIILPNWMSYVLDEDNSKIFADLGRGVFYISEKDDYKAAKETILKTREFFNSLGAPSTLREVDIDSTHFKQMAKQSVKYGEIGNFKKLGEEDVLNILKASL